MGAAKQCTNVVPATVGYMLVTRLQSTSCRLQVLHRSQSLAAGLGCYWPSLTQQQMPVYACHVLVIMESRADLDIGVGHDELAHHGVVGEAHGALADGEHKVGG